MKNFVNNELLEKYFEGRATIFEKKLIDDWAKSPQNQEVFYKILYQKERHNPQFIPDTENAISRHLKRINDLEANIVIDAIPPRKLIFWKKWMWAASILLILGITTWYNKSTILYKNYHSEFGEIKTLTLQDGSIVTLNANSTLQVPRFGFGEKVREVFLEGEGQFSVKHTIDNLPFIVKTARNLDVIVLGTEFTVFSRNRGAKVVLSKGKVRLQYSDKQKIKQILMTPGELVAFDNTNKLEKISKTIPQIHSAWTEHRFVFNETTLKEISMLFMENFGVEVKIEGKELANWTVSGSFTAKNEDELLEILADASNLTIKHQQDYILISNP